MAIECKTELEKVLYEERKFVLKERDNAYEELRKLKEKYENKFAVAVMSSDYSSTLIVRKGSVTIGLDRDELSEVLKVATKERFI